MESSWVKVVVAIVAVSLAIAPVYWMMPSPRQRQLARLRQHALSLGLRPELTSAPAVLRLAGLGDRLMKYQWHRPEGQWPRHAECWLAMMPQDQPGSMALIWAEEVGYRKGPNHLLGIEPGLASSLYAIEATPAGLGFYWHESGDDSRLDTLFEALKPWAEAYRKQFMSGD